jgi:hypothetical protein
MIGLFKRTARNIGRRKANLSLILWEEIDMVFHTMVSVTRLRNPK